MKPPHTSASIIVTNQAQRDLIDQLERKHLYEGGSIIAQVYHDGLRIRVLTPKQTSDLAEAFARVLGGPVDNRSRKSAFYKHGDPA